jgi:hypothetical protein
MSLIKKIDVDKHFAARRAIRLGRMPPLGVAIAAPVKAAAAQKAIPAFDQDFVLEHTSPEQTSLAQASPNVLAASFPIASDAARSRLLRPPRSRPA